MTVITDRDLAIAAATRNRPAAEFEVREATRGRLFTCRPTDDVREALKTMKAERVRRLPVVDADNRLQGMLSINDIVRSVSAVPITASLPALEREEGIKILAHLSIRQDDVNRFHDGVGRALPDRSHNC